MAFPKSFASANTVSQVLAVILFFQLPLIIFGFGHYQQKLKRTTQVENKVSDSQVIQNTPTTPTPIPTIPVTTSPNNKDWFRYMNPSFDYYIDFPKTYSYGSDRANAISFEKLVDYPHRTSYYIFIEKGEAIRLSEGQLAELEQMGIGEVKVVAKAESPLPSEYKTYERLPDVSFGQKKVKAFIQKTVWEASKDTHLYTYIYDGNEQYIFGGLTNENEDSQDSISYDEFKKIISTIRFLD